MSTHWHVTCRIKIPAERLSCAQFWPVNYEWKYHMPHKSRSTKNQYTVPPCPFSLCHEQGSSVPNRSSSFSLDSKIKCTQGQSSTWSIVSKLKYEQQTHFFAYKSLRSFVVVTISQACKNSLIHACYHWMENKKRMS